MKFNKLFCQVGECRVEMRDVELQDSPENWRAVLQFIRACAKNGEPPGTVLTVPMAYGKC